MNIIEEDIFALKTELSTVRFRLEELYAGRSKYLEDHNMVIIVNRFEKHPKLLVKTFVTPRLDFYAEFLKDYHFLDLVYVKFQNKLYKYQNGELVTDEPNDDSYKLWVAMNRAAGIDFNINEEIKDSVTQEQIDVHNAIIYADTTQGVEIPTVVFKRPIDTAFKFENVQTLEDAKQVISKHAVDVKDDVKGTFLVGPYNDTYTIASSADGNVTASRVTVQWIKDEIDYLSRID